MKSFIGVRKSIKNTPYCNFYLSGLVLFYFLFVKSHAKKSVQIQTIKYKSKIADQKKQHKYLRKKTLPNPLIIRKNLKFKKVLY